ncbi:MAG: glutaredoxin family protein [Casimicrobiaceae bacterium]|nr:glutaredoxin family protein [Casimicrobiaceae bacterium]MCX8097475.1 glutaredoxin family protein [Casimicrobiaceae bacterium]MDW8311193.1 glutaredoxin family protein [Burkholderiales bacterium]
MKPTSPLRRIFWVWTAGVALLLGAAETPAQTVYRYIDPSGRTVFSDQPPPPGARGVEERNVRANSIQNNPESLATQEAARRNPVVFYVTDCGEPCDAARKFLQARGVPHTLVDPTRSAELNRRFREETGGNTVPVLKIGGRVLRGFNEATWAGALDQAGYPRTPAFGAPRVVEDRRGVDEPRKEAPATAAEGAATQPSVSVSRPGAAGGSATGR